MRSGIRLRPGLPNLEVVPIIHTDSAVDRRHGSDQPVDESIEVYATFAEANVVVVPQWIPSSFDESRSLAELHLAVIKFTSKFIIAKLGRRLINSYYVVLWIRR